MEENVRLYSDGEPDGEEDEDEVDPRIDDKKGETRSRLALVSLAILLEGVTEGVDLRIGVFVGSPNREGFSGVSSKSDYNNRKETS